MKLIFLSALIILICSCSGTVEKNPAKTNKLYYTAPPWTRQESRTDVIIRHSDTDTLLVIRDFFINGKFHTITMYSNENHPKIDGGRTVYELDTLGGIFVNFGYSGDYFRLHSTNVKTDNLIELAIEVILSDPRLCCNVPKPKEIHFTIPKVIPDKH